MATKISGDIVPCPYGKRGWHEAYFLKKEEAEVFKKTITGIHPEIVTGYNNRDLHYVRFRSEGQAESDCA